MSKGTAATEGGRMKHSESLVVRSRWPTVLTYSYTYNNLKRIPSTLLTRTGCLNIWKHDYLQLWFKINCINLKQKYTWQVSTLHWKEYYTCVDEQSGCNCFVLMTEVSQLTPLLVGLPILRQPKEGAVDSTFNEQSPTLSPCSAGTASCWVDGASVDLIMWFTLSQRLGIC